MSMAMKVQGILEGQVLPTQDIPTVDFAMAVTVDDVSEDRISSTFEYRDVTVAPGVDELAATQMRRALAGFEDITGTLVTTTRGQLIEGDLEIPDDIDPVLAGFAAQMEDQFRSLTVPFPEEPVGPGASWTVDSDLDVAGVGSRLSATYTLERIAGERYTLRVELDQEVQPGSVDGGGGEILSGESSGSGQVLGSLAELVPIRSTATTSASLVMDVQVGEDATQRLEQNTDAEITFTTQGVRNRNGGGDQRIEATAAQRGEAGPA